MKADIQTIDAETAGTLRSAGHDLRPRAACGHPPPRGAVAAEQAPGGHAQGQDPRRGEPHRQEARQSEGLGRRASRLAAGAGSSSAAARPSGRGRAAMRSTCRRRCGRWRCAMRCRPRRRPSELIMLDKAEVERGEDQAAAGRFRQARARQCAHHRRRRGQCQDSRLRHAIIPNIDVLPIQGINVYDILRRQQAGADQGGCRSSGGALQMKQGSISTTSSAARRSPKRRPGFRATIRLSSTWRGRRLEAGDQGGGRGPVRRQGEGGEHAACARESRGGSAASRRMPERRQEGIRDARGRPAARCDDGPLMTRSKRQ